MGDGEKRGEFTFYIFIHASRDTERETRGVDLCMLAVDFEWEGRFVRSLKGKGGGREYVCI